MKILAVFYFTATLLDWAEHVYGVNMLTNAHIICLDSKYLTVADKKGAWYLLTLAITDFAYTIVIIIVFYEVPKRLFG